MKVVAVGEWDNLTADAKSLFDDVVVAEEVAVLRELKAP
jgi:hypothetical protein